MSFGRRQGWREGWLIIPGRTRMACRVVAHHENTVVFEIGDTKGLPFQFEIAVDGQRLLCEFRQQRGNLVTVQAQVIKPQARDETAEDPALHITHLCEWTGGGSMRGPK